uniref:MP n=1 Tax=Rhodiola betaflexivirus 1 TaxID=2794410 RepID=A0A7T5QZ91_9VIRU|nr:MP [Rhodiola betaflexivirus 1]
MSIIKVNSFASRARDSEVKIDTLSSGEVYGDASFLHPKVLNCIRRFESNIKIKGNGSDTNCMAGFPILDDEEIQRISSASEEYPFVHFGAILFCITPMFPNFKTKRGMVHLFDNSAVDLVQGHIASYEIDFKKGPSIFIVRPEHVLSSTEPHIQKCLSFSISIEDVRFLEGREIVSLDVGILYRMANSSRFLQGSQGETAWAHQEVVGARYIDAQEEVIKRLSFDRNIIKLAPVRDTRLKRPRGWFMPPRFSRKRFYSGCADGKGCEKIELVRSASDRFDKKERSFNREDERSGSCKEQFEGGRHSFSLGQLHKHSTCLFASQCGLRQLGRSTIELDENNAGEIPEATVWKYSNPGLVHKDKLAERCGSAPSVHSDVEQQGLHVQQGAKSSCLDSGNRDTPSCSSEPFGVWRYL